MLVGKWSVDVWPVCFLLRYDQVLWYWDVSRRLGPDNRVYAEGFLYSGRSLDRKMLVRDRFGGVVDVVLKWCYFQSVMNFRTTMFMVEGFPLLSIFLPYQK